MTKHVDETLDVAKRPQSNHKSTDMVTDSNMLSGLTPQVIALLKENPELRDPNTFRWFFNL